VAKAARVAATGFLLANTTFKPASGLAACKRAGNVASDAVQSTTRVPLPRPFVTSSRKALASVSLERGVPPCSGSFASGPPCALCSRSRAKLASSTSEASFRGHTAPDESQTPTHCNRKPYLHAHNAPHSPNQQWSNTNTSRSITGLSLEELESMQIIPKVTLKIILFAGYQSIFARLKLRTSRRGSCDDG